MKARIISPIILLLLVGCATHSTMRGSVAMKVTDTTAHVCLGKDEVKAGDHVELYKNVCTGTSTITRANVDRTCRKEAVGHGEVSQVLNEHYSEVKFPEGTKFQEGDIIEKHVH